MREPPPALSRVTSSGAGSGAGQGQKGAAVIASHSAAPSATRPGSASASAGQAASPPVQSTQPQGMQVSGRSQQRLPSGAQAGVKLRPAVVWRLIAELRRSGHAGYDGQSAADVARRTRALYGDDRTPSFVLEDHTGD